MPTEFESVQLPNFKRCTPDEYERLLTSNRFYFRVFHELSHTTYDEDRGFITHRYAHQTLAELKSLEDDPLQDILAVPRHLNWYDMSSSPWISAMSEWAWAVWELNRRVNKGDINKYPRLAVVDSHLLPRRGAHNDKPNYPRAFFYASERLKSLPKYCQVEEKLHDFANASAEVLFHAWIPAQAIVSVLTLGELTPKIPRYMLPGVPEEGFLWASNVSFSVFRAINCRNLSGTLEAGDKWPIEHGQAYGKLASLFLQDMIQQLHSDLYQVILACEFGLCFTAERRPRKDFGSPNCGASTSLRFYGDIGNNAYLRSRMGRPSDSTNPAQAINNASTHPGLANNQDISGGPIRLDELTALRRHCNDQIISWLNTAAQAVEPSWVTHARASIERLKEAVYDLADAIAHWLVVKYDYRDWVQIRKGIENTTRSQLAPLVIGFELHEMPDVSVAGSVEFNFENVEYARI